MKFQFRAEAFNVFNHPSRQHTKCGFGASTAAVSPTCLHNFARDQCVPIPGHFKCARVLSLTGSSSSNTRTLNGLRKNLGRQARFSLIRALRPELFATCAPRTVVKRIHSFPAPLLRA